MRVARAVTTLVYTKVRVTNHSTLLSPFIRAYSTSNTLFDNLHEHWTPAKTDVVTQRDLELDPIPSTRYWTEKELEFFKLHYYHVKDTSLWPTVFCEEAPLTANASDLVKMDLTPAEIVEGVYKNLPWHVEEFAELLFGALLPFRTEAISDHLILFLLRICNPDKVIVPEPRMKQMTTKIGAYEFVSIPDGSVRVRVPNRPFIGSTLVVTEEKQDHAEELDHANKVLKKGAKTSAYQSAEFQLPGEMVSAAADNYKLDGLPQTIFGLRFLGTRLTVCRADFPVHYLASLASGVPADDITIFRFGGEYKSNNFGFAVDGDGKSTAIQWICNIMATCTQIGRHLNNNTVHPLTAARIAQLYPRKQ